MSTPAASISPAPSPPLNHALPQSNRHRSTSGSVRPILAAAGLFDGVDPAAAAALISQLRRVNFPRGTTIFEEGTQGDTAYIILSGKVKVGSRAADGRENLLALLGPADLLGELAVFDPSGRTSTATAVTNVAAVALDRAVLMACIADSPALGHQLLRSLTRRLRQTTDALSDLIFRDVPARLAKQLLALASRFGVRHGDVIRVNHDLTQEEIAQLVGGSRESVNRALSEFSERGWIRLRGKSVLILDQPALARRAG